MRERVKGHLYPRLPPPLRRPGLAACPPPAPPEVRAAWASSLPSTEAHFNDRTAEKEASLPRTKGRGGEGVGGREKTGLCQFMQSQPAQDHSVSCPPPPAPASQAVPSRPAGVVREAGRVPRPGLGSPKGWPALKGCLSQGLGQGWVGMGWGGWGGGGHRGPGATTCWEPRQALRPRECGSPAGSISIPWTPMPSEAETWGVSAQQALCEGLDSAQLGRGQDPVQWPAGTRTS